MAIQDVPIVKEFSDIFPEEFSRLPSNHEVEFNIDFLLGTSPISKEPYRVNRA